MLPEKIRKIFEANLWYVATCGEEPNVIPVGFKCVCEDGRLAIGALLMETTLENIRKNGRVAVACADPLTGEAYQIKGRAEQVFEGEAFEHYRELTSETFKGAISLKCVVIVTPERLIDSSPNEHNKEIIPFAVR